MPRFTDANNRTWAIAINVGAIRRVRELVGINLLDPPAVQAALEDFVAFGEVLWALCDPTSPKDTFLDALSGDALLEAIPAFVDALSDFFPSQRRSEKAAEAVEAKTGPASPPAPTSSGEASTSSPESSAFIPDPSPSGS